MANSIALKTLEDEISCIPTDDESHAEYVIAHRRTM